MKVYVRPLSNTLVVEEVTTPPAQPETESSKYQPREFNATKRVPLSHSSIPTNRDGRPRGVYRRKLASLYQGIALRKPRPVEPLHARLVDASSHQGLPAWTNQTQVPTNGRDDRQYLYLESTLRSIL